MPRGMRQLPLGTMIGAKNIMCRREMN